MHRDTNSRNGNPPQPGAGELAALMRPIVETLDSTIKSELTQDPFQRDPGFVRLVQPLGRAINAYYGTEIRGWESLPTRGAMLIVGNHSGGAQTIDTAPLLERWTEERGLEAPLYMLGYDLFFAYPIVGPLLRKLGLLRANQAIARAALKRGAAVVVFPGGDHEVFRSWSQRNTIDFGGHSGFVELAIRARVPVVPMTIHGAHQSTLVLTRGEKIARGMGLERLHIKVFPFIWNIPLGVTPAFIPSLQLPAKITVQFGTPLDWSRYRPEQARDPAVQRKCYAEITGVMQETLEALARERPYPVLSRLNELRPSRFLRYLLHTEAEPLSGPHPEHRPRGTVLHEPWPRPAHRARPGLPDHTRGQHQHRRRHADMYAARDTQRGAPRPVAVHR